MVALPHCLGDLELALGTEGRDQLSDLLDLPTSFGGAGLQSLDNSADEEFLGSFAGIAACKSMRSCMQDTKGKRATTKFGIKIDYNS